MNRPEAVGRRRWRVAGWMAAVLAVLVLAGAAVGLYVLQSRIDPNEIKRQLIAAVEQATGRQLRIDGPVRLHLLPRPQISAQGLSLANMAGGSASQMVRVSSADAQIAVLPLLSHQVSLQRVMLYAPDVVLERLPAGRWNWQFEPPARSAAPGGTVAGAQGVRHGQAAAWALSLEHLRIQGGSLTVIRHRADDGVQVEAIKLRDLHADSVSGQAPTLRLRATHDGAPFTLEARIGPLASVFRGWPVLDWPVRLMVMQDNGGTDDGVIRGVGSLSGGAARRDFALDLHAAEPDLASLNGLFPHAGLPSMQAIALSAALSGSLGPLGASQAALHVRSLHLQAGATDLTRFVRGLRLGSLAVDAATPDVPVRLTLNGAVNGQATVLKGTFGTLSSLEEAVAGLIGDGGARLVPSLGRRLAKGDAVPVLPVDLALRSAGTQVDLRGSLGGGQSHVLLHAAVPDLQALRPQAPHLTQVSLDAALSAEQGLHFELHGLHFTSGEVAVTGDVQLDLTSRPKLTARLAAPQLDLDALRDRSAGSPASVPGVQQGVLRAPDWHHRPLPWKMLDMADGDVSVTVGHLRVEGDSYDGLTAHAVLSGGVLSIDPLEVNGPQGLLNGRLLLRAPSAAQVAHVAVTLHAPAVPLAALLTRDAGSWRGVQGNMQVEANLAADGETISNWGASLGGTLGLSAVDGAVPNAALASAAAMLGVSGGVRLAASGLSAVRCAAVALRFTGGVGAIDPLVLDATRLRMHGAGSVDLGHRLVDLHLVPTVMLGSAGATTPVRVEGWPGALHAAMEAGLPGGRFGLVIGGGPPPDVCPAALVAARFGQPGPEPASQPAERKHDTKALDLLRGLGLLH